MTEKIFDVYTVVPSQKEGDKDRWRMIGAAFGNTDGSITVLFDGPNGNNKLVLRKPEPIPEIPAPVSQAQGRPWGTA